MNKLFDSRLAGIEDDKSSSALSAWKPHVDIKEDGEQYTVIADLPGVDPKDIKVSMEHNVLTIQGERKSESDTKTEDYHRIERFSGSFYRQFTLPDNADSNKISVKCQNGVLKISIPKTNKTTSKLIKVESEN
jgi:HSP20 family protein